MSSFRQIVIIDEQCIASQYGVKTYIDQLIDIFSTLKNIYVYHVRFLTSDKEVVCAQKGKNIIMMRISS
jgi:hypothetical protein